MGGHHRPRRHDVGAVPDHGGRRVVDAEAPRDPWHRVVRGGHVPHCQLAARRRRPLRIAGRRHWHGVVRHPVDPAHRRAGRPSHRVSTHAQLFVACAECTARSDVCRGAQGRLRGIPQSGPSESHRCRDSAPRRPRDRCRPRRTGGKFPQGLDPRHAVRTGVEYADVLIDPAAKFVRQRSRRPPPLASPPPVKVCGVRRRKHLAPTYRRGLECCRSGEGCG